MFTASKNNLSAPVKFSIANGFTLVELAIVLMIIGLLIGGVLRGQELMENARVTSTIQQVKAYQGAFHTFADAYSNYPGDFAQATTKIPNCNAGTFCANGDGNGIIGAQNAGQGTYANEPWQPVDPSIASENTQFWKHLAAAHMISGVNPSANVPEWGRSHPAAKINGGFFMRYSNVAVGVIAYTGHVLVLRKNITGDATGCPGNGFCTVTPLRAAQIDRKFDDGIAITGSVWSVSSNWSIGCGVQNAGINGPSGYAENNSDETCDMIFKIN